MGKSRDDMHRGRLRAFLAVVLFATFISTCFFVSGPPGAAAGTVVLIDEDFERVWPDKYFNEDPTPGSWRLGDSNLVSGSDYWGVSSHRSFDGGMSAWCAQVGNNSVNDVENRVNHYYDQDMSAFMELYVGNLFGYDNVTLTFAYWARTGNTTLIDSFEVRYYNGATWRVLWEQPSVNSGGWVETSVDVPTNSSWISFYFMSGVALPGGPYEGVYIDALTLIGEDSVSPNSFVGSVPEYSTSATFEIPIIASDQLGSGVQYVELFYRIGSAGNFSQYNTSEVLNGRWQTPLIDFNSSLTGGDGSYEFYTVATDGVGNVETTPSEPDAVVVVDTSPPVTRLNISSVSRNGWYDGWVLVSIEAEDNTSGVAQTVFASDSDMWQTYSSPFMYMTDRVHTIKAFTEDKAGNREANRTFEVKIDTTNPELSNVAVRNIPQGSNDSTAIVFWTITDGTSGLDHFNISLDGGPIVAHDNLTTWVSLEHLSDGNHTLVIAAYDQAGNVLVATFIFDTDASKDRSGVSPMLLWGAAVGAIVLTAAVGVFLARGRWRPEQD